MYSPLVFLLTFVVGLALASMQDYYDCKPCNGEECDAIPKGCLYGHRRNACRRMECKSGPGQRCGGPDNHLGRCGEGMKCECGKCKGCSIDRLYSGVIECDYTNPICT